MKKYDIVFILIGFLCHSILLAQENPETEINTRVPIKNVADDQHTAIFFQSGIHFGEYGEINKILADSNLATFEKTDFAIGGGFMARFNHLLFQFDFYKLSQCVVMADETCSHVNFNSNGFSAGYLINKSSIHHIYPLIGVHRNRTEFLVADNDLLSMNVANYLTGFSNVSQITRHNYTLNLAFAYDFRYPICKSYRLSLLFGVRAGYNSTLNQGTWYEHEDEVELTAGPKVNPGGGYLKIVTGFYF